MITELGLYMDMMIKVIETILKPLAVIGKNVNIMIMGG